MKRILCIVWLAMLAAPVAADVIERVLVKVNGDIITQTEFEKRQIAFLRQAGRQDVLNDDAALEVALREATPQLILNAVDELILSQRGRELGYALSDEQFNDVIANLKTQNEITTDGEFQQALAGENMTMAELRRSLERQMLISRVQQVEVFGNFSVTEEEQRAYYQAHLDEFTDPPTVTLREILLEVPDAAPAAGGQAAFNVAQDERAKERMEAVRARIEAGEDFAVVAGEVSEAASRANGGLVGPLNRDDLAPAFVDALSRLQPGELSGVMRTPRGYHLIRLETASVAQPKPFGDVQSSIAEKIFNGRRVQEVDKYLLRLRSQAIIDWKNDDLKAAYDQGLATQAAQTRPPS